MGVVEQGTAIANFFVRWWSGEVWWRWWFHQRCRPAINPLSLVVSQFLHLPLQSMSFHNINNSVWPRRAFIAVETSQKTEEQRKDCDPSQDFEKDGNGFLFPTVASEFTRFVRKRARAAAVRSWPAAGNTDVCPYARGNTKLSCSSRSNICGGMCSIRTCC